MAEKRQTHEEGDVLTRSETDVRRPPLYRVLLHNDDYTPMDFVVGILELVFHRSKPDAVQIMLNVHKRGIGVAGIYPYEIAETKVHQVHLLATQAEHPLKCSLEKA